ncbi:MAG TPA: tryptophan--tRNA ligase [Haliangiales bacterium]|nr:tryptophan--tRNA ligase [Haliangiales bacterium]
MSAEARPVVVSGIQPNGSLHLGNYIGALSYWVDNQTNYHNYLFLADLHALTIPEEITAAELRRNVREAAALYLAAGIDPDDSTIFLQSAVPAHAYLGWIMTCFAPLGWLERMTQFKSKSKGRSGVGAGVLTYPALQAADILLYDADFVPVGDDQKQHVELARDLAQRVNGMFGDCLKVPQPLIRASGARVMGLDDATEKMSKSLAVGRPGHAVGMLDDADTIRRKLRAAKTDPGNEARFDSAGPGVKNLLTIYEVLTREPRAAIEEKFHGKGYKLLKDEVAEAIIVALGPVQQRYRALMQDPAHVDAILARGAERAGEVAERTLARVRDRLGL